MFIYSMRELNLRVYFALRARDVRCVHIIFCAPLYLKILNPLLGGGGHKRLSMRSAHHVTNAKREVPYGRGPGPAYKDPGSSRI